MAYVSVFLEGINSISWGKNRVPTAKFLSVTPVTPPSQLNVPNASSLECWTLMVSVSVWQEQSSKDRLAHQSAVAIVLHASEASVTSVKQLQLSMASPCQPTERGASVAHAHVTLATMTRTTILSVSRVVSPVQAAVPPESA